MERLTKRYNEHTGTYEYIDAFKGAGIFDSIMKGITSTFVKETAKKVVAKALEAAADKVGSHVGEYAVKKAISAVTKPPPKEVKTIISKEAESDDESAKPLGNVIMKELNKKSDKLTSSENVNAARKKQYYSYGTTNKKFQSKLNKLLN